MTFLALIISAIGNVALFLAWLDADEGRCYFQHRVESLENSVTYWREKATAGKFNPWKKGV